MFVNVTRASSCVCVKIAEATWKELSDTWFRVGYYGVCIKDMETLFVWGIFQSVYGSSKFKILIYAMGFEW